MKKNGSYNNSLTMEIKSVISESTPEHELMAAIVLKAVDDWRGMIKRRAWDNKHANPNNNIIELREFFHSEWFETICAYMRIDPAAVVETLERELAEAQKEAR